MTKKGENIYKRKDGRWEGRYKKGRKDNGQLKYGYIYGKTYTEVKQKMYEYKAKYQNSIQLTSEDEMLYKEWVVIWISDHRLQIKTSTYTTYIYKLKKYILPIIGDIELNQLNDNKIQEVITIWMQRGLKSSTIHVLHHILKKSLNDAYDLNQLSQKPCQKIRLPKKQKVHAKAITRQEQKKLENRAKSCPFYKGSPVLLSLNTGLRIGEISALRWSDIDLEQRIIHVQNTFQRLILPNEKNKTKLTLDTSKTESSDRIIPISLKLYEYLIEWKKESISQYVCSKKNGPSEPRMITYYFHQIRNSCGLENIHFHQLRHTFATRCIESNGDIASISKLLGHTSIKTTLDIYTDSLFESQQQVIQKMEEAKI